MSKSCDECKHDEKTALEEPCSRCYRYEQFEQKEEKEPQPAKTLLDEFAMAAMIGLLAGDKDETYSPHNGSLADDALNHARRMMKERARRDEMGNVKEVK